MEVVTVSSKGQITIPSRLRKKMNLEEGEALLITEEDGAIKIIPVPKLSKLAGVDREVFRGKVPSKEVEETREEWDKEFEKRLKEA